MLTLWDLIEPILKLRPRKRGEVARPKVPSQDDAAGSKTNGGGVGAEHHGDTERAARDVERPAVRAITPNEKARDDARSRREGRRGLSKEVVEDRRGPSGHPREERRGASVATESAQERYDRVVQTLLREYGIRVRKWRSNMSGIAWYVTYRDGTISRLIETPRPKGPMSMAVFLHEVGHHAIGFNRYKPRCLEEYHAWAWAIDRMEKEGLNITEGVRHRMRLSLWYAVDKARRRGLKELPVELAPYVNRPVKPKKRRRGEWE